MSQLSPFISFERLPFPKGSLQLKKRIDWVFFTNGGYPPTPLVRFGTFLFFSWVIFCQDLCDALEQLYDCFLSTLKCGPGHIKDDS